MKSIKKIAVLTSGGDAPGMNAAIRAVTRTALSNGIEVAGVLWGYEGLIYNNFRQLESADVSNIIQTGGTILKTARSEKFKTKEGRATAFKNLKDNKIDGLVLIGGDGTFKGASILSDEHDLPVVGIPGTIDNDIFGTDYTIGYDTAINNVMHAVDKIKDSASAHNRVFFIEVMGNEAGFIAIRSGIATGSEAILIPEVSGQIAKLKKLIGRRGKQKRSTIIIVAEGEREGNIYDISKSIQDEFKELDIRVTILGHIQRGGSPTAYDRVSASRMGVAAVEAMLNNKRNIMVGLVNNEITYVPLNKTYKEHKSLNKGLLKIVDTLL